MTIKWDLVKVMGEMEVSDSFFIPCLDCERVQREIKAVAAKLKINTVVHKSTENYIKGLRTWRIKE